MSPAFRSVCAAAFAATLLVLSSLWSPGRASPEVFVRSLSQQILAAARTSNTSQFRALLRRYADVRGISDFALGRYKSKIPSSQLSTYYSLAEDAMVNFFERYSGSLNGTGVSVNRVSQSGSFVLVETTIDGGGGSVSWRLSQRGGYKVFDVQVAGIWLGHLMRSSYSSKLRRGGYKSLFAFMRQ